MSGYILGNLLDCSDQDGEDENEVEVDKDYEH